MAKRIDLATTKDNIIIQSVNTTALRPATRM